ncbi:MAG: trimethylamine methyltransferase family protein [Candidatus Bathyarchaeia archaeon]
MKAKIGQPVEFLSKKEVEAIDFLSCMLLEKVGVKVENTNILERMQKFGCEVNKDRSIVRIPRILINEARKKAVSPTALYGRRKDATVLLGPDQVHFTTDGYGSYVIDFEKGERRHSTLKDIEYSAIICDYLEALSIFWPPVSAQDVPPHLRKMYEYYTSVSYITKHIQPDIHNREEAAAIIEMATIIKGDEKSLRKSPIVSMLVGSASPLELPSDALISGFEFASRRLPVVVYSMPLMGVSAPANPPATLILSNAEILALITIFTLLYPGTPLIYCSFASASDPISGKYNVDPRNAWLQATSCQLAKYYGLSSFIGGFGTSSKLPDAQMGFEEGLSAILSTLAGANIISGFGLIESSNVLSYEKLVIDNEFCKMALETLNRYSNHISIESLNPYIQLIEKIGHGGYFLAERQTCVDLRKLWFSSIFDYSTHETWVKKGRKGIIERAREKTKEILKTHKPEELPQDIMRELDNTIRECKHKKESICQESTKI